MEYVSQEDAKCVKCSVHDKIMYKDNNTDKRYCISCYHDLYGLSYDIARAKNSAHVGPNVEIWM